VTNVVVRENGISRDETIDQTVNGPGSINPRLPARSRLPFPTRRLRLPVRSATPAER
jgi:hypothetical protein